MDTGTALRNFLEKDEKIVQAILFGSYAKGTQTACSDMDIAIQLAEPMTPQQKLDYLDKIQERTGAVVDLIDLHRVGQPLLSQIVKYGRRLKGSSTQYVEIALKNVNTSQDFLPFIKRMMKERRERLLNG
jgi:predicted nucleotidyltransferase